MLQLYLDVVYTVRTSVHLTVVPYRLGGVLACTSKYTCLNGYINSHYATIFMYVQRNIFTKATNAY